MGTQDEADRLPNGQDADAELQPGQVMVRLRPGQSVVLTTEEAWRGKNGIYAMGLGGGKILFTGGADLVEAIEGSDWDWKARLDETTRGTVYQDPYADDRVLQSLRIAVVTAVAKFYANQMLKPNLVVIPLEYRHLGLRHLCGYPVAYGYMPIGEVLCAYVPPAGTI